MMLSSEVTGKDRWRRTITWKQDLLLHCLPAGRLVVIAADSASSSVSSVYIIIEFDSLIGTKPWIKRGRCESICVKYDPNSAV